MNVGADKGFQATTNARNEAMLTEAGEFANHLKRCEKDIRGLKQSTEGGRAQLQDIYILEPIFLLTIDL